MFTPDGVDNDNLDRMIPGWGYWVLAKNNTNILIGGSLFSPIITPPSKDIASGWNLIGYYGNEDKNGDPLFSYNGPVGAGKQAKCALASLVDTNNGYPKWSSLFTYWEPYNPNQIVALNSTSSMDPGAGYWMDIDVAETYSLSTTC